MKIWYNVEIHGKPSFGFAAKDGRIENFPTPWMVGGRLSQADIRHWFTSQGARVIKIAEQLEYGDCPPIHQI